MAWVEDVICRRLNPGAVRGLNILSWEELGTCGRGACELSSTQKAKKTLENFEHELSLAG